MHERLNQGRPSLAETGTDDFKSKFMLPRALTTKHLAPHGQHVMIDLTGFLSNGEEDGEWMLALLKAAVNRSTAREVHAHVESFDGVASPPGFAAVVLLDESHISAHCYSDRGWLAIDCFTCGGTDADGIADDVLNHLRESMPGIVVHRRSVVDRFLHPVED